MRYKALLIAAALLAAPVAFAEDGSRTGNVPPPPPGQQQGGHHEGGMFIMHARMQGDMDEHMGSSTNEQRPLSGAHNMGNTQNPGQGWGDTRGDGEHEHMLASTTPPVGEAASSTPAFFPGFLRDLFKFFPHRHRGDSAVATSTPPAQEAHAQGQGEDNQSDNNSESGTTSASTTVEAGVQEHGSIMPILQFFRHFFDFIGQ